MTPATSQGTTTISGIASSQGRGTTTPERVPPASEDTDPLGVVIRKSGTSQRPASNDDARPAVVTGFPLEGSQSTANPQPPTPKHARIWTLEVGSLAVVGAYQLNLNINCPSRPPGS